MRINFFATECQELERNDVVFGICDNEDGSKAYTRTDARSDWNAEILNPNGLQVRFSAIDACVQIFRDNQQMERSCDGMLLYADNLVLVELKNVRTAWIEIGLDQLVSTLNVFSEHHDLSAIRHKRAFLCNRRHRAFEVLNLEQKRRFFDRYRVRLNVSGTIKI